MTKSEKLALRMALSAIAYLLIKEQMGRAERNELASMVQDARMFMDQGKKRRAKKRGEK